MDYNLVQFQKQQKGIEKMQMNQRTPAAIVNAAAGMLAPYVPALSAQTLLKAIESYNSETKAKTERERPMSRKETAALLGVSLATLNRYMNIGLLHRVKIGSKTVRIDPQSVRDLLERGSVEA